MALTNNTLPSIPPTRAVPYDALTAFAIDQTLTATGYVNNINAVVDIGPGRFDGVLVLDLKQLDETTTDEVYKLCLFGSNDIALGNGNVDLLAMHDFAGLTANRLVATILAPTPAVPTANKTATRYNLLFSNQMGEYTFRYLGLYLVASGTTPILKISAWVAPLCD